MSDLPGTDEMLTMACGLYVKSWLAKEVDHDILMSKSYMDQYKDMKRRLLGYQTTLVPGSTLDPIVRVYLPTDSDRQGIQPLLTQLIANAYQDVQGTFTFIEKALREAVVDVQCLVPQYRITQTTLYQLADVTAVGGLTRGQMPMGAQFYEAYLLEAVPALAENTPYQIGEYVSSNGRTYMVLSGGLLPTGTLGAGLQSTNGAVEALGGTTFVFRYFEPCIRSRCRQYDWHQRYEFNRLPTGCKTRRQPSSVMIDNDGYTFYTWPQVTSTNNLTYQMTWTNPTVFNFQDADLVPFDDDVEACVAEFVWAKYYNSVEQDRLQSQTHGQLYANMLRALYAEARNKNRIVDTK